MMVILSSKGEIEGMKVFALNWTQPSAALVMMKVLPEFTERDNTLKDASSKVLI